jgi:hypothetical protein
LKIATLSVQPDFALFHRQNSHRGLECNRRRQKNLQSPV